MRVESDLDFPFDNGQQLLTLQRPCTLIQEEQEQFKPVPDLAPDADWVLPRNTGITLKAFFRAWIASLPPSTDGANGELAVGKRL